MDDNSKKTHEDVSSVEEILARRRAEAKSASPSPEVPTDSEDSLEVSNDEASKEEDNSNTGIYISALSVVIVFALAIALMYLFGPVSTRRQASAFVTKIEDTINNEDAEDIALLFETNKAESILYLINSKEELISSTEAEDIEVVEQIDDILAVIGDRTISFSEIEIVANSNLRAIATGQMILDNEESQDFEFQLRKVNDNWQIVSGLFDDFFEILMEE